MKWNDTVRRWAAALLLVAGSLALVGCTGSGSQPSVDLGEVDISQFRTEQPYVELNGNQPAFTDKEKKNTEAFETYSSLDSLGRCGVAQANLCRELMPTEPRGEIGQVKPAGWHTVKYDWVDGKYLYNRCHLIGFQLTGENANERNLITGTRYFNSESMLPFEEMVGDYIRQTGNHVLYRVTPLFEGRELVARGVRMEARSVEDDGRAVSFNVYCHNVQPGVDIDYATGDNRLAERAESGASGADQHAEIADYVINVNTRKFHLPECTAVEDIAEKNKQLFTGSCDDLIEQGLAPCKKCNPCG